MHNWSPSDHHSQAPGKGHDHHIQAPSEGHDHHSKAPGDGHQDCLDESRMENRELGREDPSKSNKARNSGTKVGKEYKEEFRNEGVNLTKPKLPTQPSWGYESPSQLNREVTTILSKGNPPETERSQFTHPSQCSPVIPPREVTSRSNSCPLYQNTYTNPKLWTSGSPFQVPDQSAELRNHFYQAALYQNSSPFTAPRFPFLPVNRGYFPSFPPNMDSSQTKLPFPPPYNLQPYHQAGARSSGQMKRKISEDDVTSSKLSGMHTNSRQQTHPTQSSSSITNQATVQHPSSSPSSILPSTGSCPPHFKKGSMIQLANGEMKKVEDLDTTDFLESANICHDVSIEQSTVLRLELVQPTGLFMITFNVGKRGEEVTISASQEHPFFVYGQGWSSCSPSLSMARYSLSCHQLAVGDTCISLMSLVDSNSASLLMPPPHTSPETVKDFKQVRFQESPTPKKKKHSHDPILNPTPSETPPPLSVRVRVSQTSPSPMGSEKHTTEDRQRLGEERSTFLSPGVVRNDI